MAQSSTSVCFASAISDAQHTGDAVDAAISQLQGRLPGNADLVVFFASSHHASHFSLIYDRLSEALGAPVTLGMTCEGVIGVRTELQQSPGLSVLVGSMPQTVIHPFCYDDLDWPKLLQSPLSLSQQIDMGDIQARGMMMLADPFSTPMVRLLPAINQCWPRMPVVGGMASAGRQPGENRMMVNDRIVASGAVGVIFGGQIQIDCTVSQGCRPIGRPFVITKSKRHLVMELGGNNALQALQEMAQDLPDEDRELLQNHGLLVGRVINEYRERFGRGDFLIRSLMGVEQDAGYIAIGDPQIRVGQTIQFHVRDEKTALEDFSLLLEGQKIYGQPGGALLFSCNGRGTRLFSKPNADAGMIHRALGDVPLAGCFAAGEIGPIGEENHLHGHTASLAVFRATDAV